MKVVTKQHCNHVPISTLSCGTVCCQAPGMYFMKINHAGIGQLNPDKVYGVSIEDGSLIIFNGNDRVYVVNAEVHIL
jgi:hypothetical protein